MILGRFTKQPIEEESYSIFFERDMSDSDSIVRAWCSISDALTVEQSIIAKAPIVASVDKAIYYTDFGVTLNSQPDGFSLSISNTDQVQPISIASDGIEGAVNFSLPARTSIYLERVSAQWVIQAKAVSTAVIEPGSQRVSTKVIGGQHENQYKVEVTVKTLESRVLQNEFIVKVKDS